MPYCTSRGQSRAGGGEEGARVEREGTVISPQRQWPPFIAQTHTHTNRYCMLIHAYTHTYKHANIYDQYRPFTMHTCVDACILTHTHSFTLVDVACSISHPFLRSMFVAPRA